MIMGLCLRDRRIAKWIVGAGAKKELHRVAYRDIE